MINFDKLPDKSPNNIIPKGTYYATVEEALMKQGKDVTKPEYLNIKYSLKKPDGSNVGILYDILTESEHQLMQYKLKRFLNAAELTFTGPFELKDIAKVIKGKTIIMDTTIDEKNEPIRACVDLFSKEVFYKESEAKEIFDYEDLKVEPATEEAPKEAPVVEPTKETLQF